MNTIDRYILRKFMGTFFFTVLIFTLIIVIVDFSSKVEKFVESDITTSEVLLQYFPNFVAFMYGLLFPLFTLISVVFFTSRLANNSEILSIFNGGVSFVRLLRPYLIGALIITALHALGNHYFIPKGTETRLLLELKYFDPNKDLGKQRNIHMWVDTNAVLSANFWRKADTTIRGFQLARYEGHELRYMLKATAAEWKGETGKWQLTNYERRSFNGLREGLVIGTGKQLDTLLNLVPEDFVDYKEQQTMFTTPQLANYIQRQKTRGAGNTAKYITELHRRIADPVTVIILTLIGVAIAGRKVRGGLGIHLALGVLIGAVYLILSRFSTVFAASNAMPIVLSMWMPNIVFGLVAYVLIRRAQQ